MMTRTNETNSVDPISTTQEPAGVNPKLWSIMAKLTEVKLILDNYTESPTSESYQQSRIRATMKDNLFGSIADGFFYVAELMQADLEHSIKLNQNQTDNYDNA